MEFKLLYLDEVLNDIQNAKSWYQEQKLGLEKKFAFEIEKALQKILKSPYAYAV